MTTRATALVAKSEELRTTMLEAVNGRRLVTAHRRFRDVIPVNAECVVLGIDGTEIPKELEEFALQPVLESAPLIVVCFGVVPQWLGTELNVTAFVSGERAKSRLVPRILQAICGRMRERMREEVRTSLLPPVLSKAISRALRASENHPLRRPSHLAAAVGITLPTLDEAFRAATGGSFTVTEFLAALQLVRALEHRTAGLTWTAAADHLGFTRRSLSRKSNAWLGCTLPDVEAWDPPALLARFEEDYLRPIVDSG